MNQADQSLRYLLGRLAIIESSVARAVQRRRSGDPEPSDPFRGLYLSDQHIDRLLTDPDMRSMGLVGSDVDALRAAVESAADKAEQGGTRLRLRRVAAEFGLSPFDVDVLLASIAPDLDPRFEKLFGYLHDDVTRRRASVGLAIELAGSSPIDPEARVRLDPGAPLQGGGLLLVEEADRPYLTRSLRVPDRVTSHLLGSEQVDPLLRELVRSPLSLGTAEGERIARALGSGVRLVYCSQPLGLWAGAVVAAALDGQEFGVLVIDLSSVGHASFGDIARAAIREARLVGRVLVMGPVDGIDSASLRVLTKGASPVVLYGSGPWDPGWSDEGVLLVDLHSLARKPSVEAWEAVLSRSGTFADSEAMSAFRLAPNQIERAAGAAVNAALADGAPLTTEHLAAGARSQNLLGLGRLARRVEPSVTWPDLVLTPLAQSSLQHLTDRVRLRETVEGAWGMRRGGGRGEGITALFAGEPGTGKTMAAEVVAGDLGFDLYVIDLSSVVDKYIGETEKNLERLFAGAEDVNGVLFFDEADALFGKRSEVNDARDRYANLETSYLLQRMETFDGLAILGTNLRSNLDPAFTRRLSIVVEFTRPDVDERRLLWQKALGAVPLNEDVDLEFCAEAFDVAGGDIRNIAMTVAYLAAAARRPVDMELLMRGIQTEYRKLGRLCVEAEFGVYYPLIAGSEHKR